MNNNVLDLSNIRSLYLISLGFSRSLGEDITFTLYCIYARYLLDSTQE